MPTLNGLNRSLPADSGVGSVNHFSNNGTDATHTQMNSGFDANQPKFPDPTKPMSNIDQKSVSNNFPGKKNNVIAGMIALLVIFAGMLVAGYLINQSQELRQQAAGETCGGEPLEPGQVCIDDQRCEGDVISTNCAQTCKVTNVSVIGKTETQTTFEYDLSITGTLGNEAKYQVSAGHKDCGWKEVDAVNGQNQQITVTHPNSCATNENQAQPWIISCFIELTEDGDFDDRYFCSAESINPEPTPTPVNAAACYITKDCTISQLSAIPKPGDEVHSVVVTWKTTLREGIQQENYSDYRSSLGFCLVPDGGTTCTATGFTGVNGINTEHTYTFNNALEANKKYLFTVDCRNITLSRNVNGVDYQYCDSKNTTATTWECVDCMTPTPSPTLTPSPTPTSTPSSTPSPTPSPTLTPSPTPTSTPSSTPSPTPSSTPSPTPTSSPPPQCGDELINSELGEECDLGDQNGTTCQAAYGQTCEYCDSACQSQVIVGPYCGDGAINGTEQCDGGEWCTDTCVLQGPMCLNISAKNTTTGETVASNSSIKLGDTAEFTCQATSSSDTIYYSFRIQTGSGTPQLFSTNPGENKISHQFLQAGAFSISCAPCINTSGGESICDW